MRRENNPCYQCTKRCEGCHTFCEEGIAADKEWAEERRKINKAKRRDQMQISAANEGKKRMMTRRKSKER